MLDYVNLLAMKLNLPRVIVVRLHVHKIRVGILTQETEDSVGV